MPVSTKELNKKQLWLRVQAYHFDNLVSPNLWSHITAKFGGTDASTKAFADKIARKAGWSQTFSLKAISEYKKFIYLGVISDFAATPSKIIDKVWHEHILFSKAYREFCSNVIQSDFDHYPELIPFQEQTASFNAQYLDTIKLYKTEFGFDPPERIWSVPKFDLKPGSSGGYQSTKKKLNSGYSDDMPLCTYFAFTESQDHSNAFAEFIGFDGGDGGGAGANGSWEFSNSSDSATSSGDDSGSGCSSGCSSCGGGD